MLSVEPRIDNTDKVRDDGVVYTPKILANYVAQKLVEAWYQDQLQGKRSHSQVINSLEKLKIIDPSCGEGELLLALMDKLLELPGASNISFAEKLYGFDLDKDAINITKKRLKKMILFT